MSQARDGQRKAIKDSPTPLKNKCEHAKTQYQKNRKNGPTQTVPPDLRLPRKNAYMKKALWAQTRDRNVSTTVARTRLFKRFLPHGASPARALRRQFESARTSYSTSLLAASLDPKQHPTPDATDRTRTPNSPHNVLQHPWPDSALASQLLQTSRRCLEQVLRDRHCGIKERQN